MRKFIIILVLLLVTVSNSFAFSAAVQAVLGRGSVAAPTEVLWDSYTSDNDYWGVNTTSVNAQYLANAASLTISKVILKLYGTSFNGRVEIWSDAQRQGTQYGASSDLPGATTVNTPGQEVTFTWTGTKPVVTGNFYLHYVYGSSTSLHYIRVGTGVAPASYYNGTAPGSAVLDTTYTSKMYYKVYILQ